MKTESSSSPARHAQAVPRTAARKIGDRTPGEEVTCPDDDLQIATIGGRRQFAHKNGTPY